MSGALHPLPSRQVLVARHDQADVTGYVSIDDAATYLGMGRRFVEELLARSDLHGKRFGRSIRILFAELQEWAARQPDWKER